MKPVQYLRPKICSTKQTQQTKQGTSNEVIGYPLPRAKQTHIHPFNTFATPQLQYTGHFESKYKHQAHGDGFMALASSDP